MSKHTPGPWMVYRESSVDRGTSYGIKAPHPHYWVIPPLNIKEEDAKLMAASRELLEALESLCDCIHETRGPSAYNALKVARAAIAKAKGEQ